MRKNRLIIIGLIALFAFGLLFYTLFDMSVVRGDDFIKQADNTRKKQINEKATRGNIYDRNGQLLAGNRPIYNLNVYVDRFKRVDIGEKNEVLLNLVHILEEDGVPYLEDFFIGIYQFVYDDHNDYFTSPTTPTKKVVDLVKKNNLMGQIIDSKEMIGKTNGDHYYYPINRVMDYMEERGKNLPIEVEKGEEITLSFIKNERYKELVKDKKIRKGETARQFLLRTIKGDDSLYYNLMGHPLSRKLVYSMLKDRGLEENIRMTGISYNTDINYIENKAQLNRLSDRVTLKSDAKNDFIALVKDNTLQSLLSMARVDENKKLIVPAEQLINTLNGVGLDIEVNYEVNEDKTGVKIFYSDGKERDEKALDYLIRMADKHNILDEFITSKNIVDLAEQSLFSNNIYPHIMRSGWIYSYEKDKADFLEKNKVDQDISVEDFIKIYMDKYKLESYGIYEAFAISSIYNKLSTAGYKGYEPINLARNISRKTLVEVEEKLPKDLGFEVVVQPNRYYPFGNSLSHSLGYLGKISDEFEVKEYVEHRKYSSDDVIGKTGLEESFEDTLRGTNGKKLVYTDVYGNTTDTIEEIPSVPGNNLHTTIDMDFQKDVEKILKDMIEAKRKGEDYMSYLGKRRVEKVPTMETGAIVVTNVKTGEVLASVSYPDFDPNIFVNGISNNDWKSLSEMNDAGVYDGKPLMNLVTQAALPPGSTFKTVVSLAALEKGLNPKQNITCYGFIDIGNSRFNCLIYTSRHSTHGPINLYDALKVSCNYYFYSLGLGENPKKPGELDVKVGLEDIEKTVDKLGLNKQSGLEINIPVESGGYSPSLYDKQNIIRNRLRNFLLQNIDKYVKEDVKKNSEQVVKDINEIGTWTEKGPEMSRNEVIEKLEEMGYHSEKRLNNNKVGLADRIKYSYLNQAIWTKSDSLNMVIGQGQNAYTPIQLNGLASIIANEGKRVKPTFVKKISNFDNTKDIFVNTPEESDVGIKKSSFKEVKEGMRRAAANNYNHSRLPFEMGTKTGTAQSESIDPKTGKKYKNIVWEMGFAPYKDPEIAVTVVLVQGDMSPDAAKVFNDVIYSYYKIVKKDPAFNRERIIEEDDLEKKSKTKEKTDQEDQIEDPQIDSQEENVETIENFEEEEEQAIPNLGQWEEIDNEDLENTLEE